MSEKFLTNEELAKYPKAVILEAIRQHAILRPKQRDLDNAWWQMETNAGLADMDASIAAQKALGSLPEGATYAEFEAHHKVSMKLHDDFDRAQARIDAANRRWEKANP